jgi:TolA-binding protein
VKRAALATLVLVCSSGAWAGPAPAVPPVRQELPEPPPGVLELLRARSPQDTVGDGAYAVALRAFDEGRFDEAQQRFQQFTQLYPRNLKLNDALSAVLLIHANREFKDEPLRIYATAEALRRAGRADSASALVRSGLVRYPGARIRDHWNWLLAEIASGRGDHAGAIAFAVAVADTAQKSRLAPYALKLAAEETLAMAGDPTRALRFYQDLLERYPGSPLAPEVRARALELRRKLQL